MTTANGTWSITWVPQTNTDSLAQLLSQGWEPFAVTGPSGPASNISPNVYLRRLTPEQPKGPTPVISHDPMQRLAPPPP